MLECVLDEHMNKIHGKEVKLQTGVWKIDFLKVCV